MIRLRVLLPASLALLLAALPLTAGAEQPGLPFPAPVDPESWALPEWQTVEDHRPIPGVDWNDPARQAVKPIRAAMIFGDFPDRPFVVTEEVGSDVFGVDQEWADRVPGYTGPVANPIVGGVAREDVGEFYTDLIVNRPSELNFGHTVNEYWLEDSYGLIGVDATPFGPYQVSGKEHEYGLGGTDAGGGGAQCPAEDNCGEGALPLIGNFDDELIQLAAADTTTGMAFNAEDYDFRWLVHAGYDESGTWQEFGEMMFAGPEAVTERFGPPSPVRSELGFCEGPCPNAAGTRYVPWSSWAASEGIWSHAIPGVSSTQGENDGSAVFAHELSHIFGVLDNYNNPYANPVRRSYTGPWAMLSRGAFNGPGGAHTRWQIPAVQGASMGSHHMLRNKIRLGFTPPSEVLTLDARALSATGPVAAEIYPRAYPLTPITSDVGLHGVVVNLGRDRSPSCSVGADHTCDGGGYDNYTIEVVDQMGHDSYTPDSGVLIAKNKTGTDLGPFMWAIDAHPEDINTRTGVGEHEGREIFDFIRPGTGERAAISLGDARQLADSLFHAGTGEGVVDEHVDEANRLHFYVLDTTATDDVESVGTYRVAVRSLDGHGPIDPASSAPATVDPVLVAAGEVAEVDIDVTNASPTTDILRLTATGTDGVEVQLPYEIVRADLLDGGTITVHLGAMEPTTGAVQVTATSELTGDTFTVAVPVTVTVTGEDEPAAGLGLLALLPALGVPALITTRRRRTT